MIKQMKIWCYKELTTKEKRNLYAAAVIIILLIAIRITYQIIRKEVFKAPGSSLLLDIITISVLLVVIKELFLIIKLLVFNRQFKVYLLPRMLYERDKKEFLKDYNEICIDATGVVLCHDKGIKYLKKWLKNQSLAFEDYEDYDGFFSSYDGKKKSFDDVSLMFKGRGK